MRNLMRELGICERMIAKGYKPVVAIPSPEGKAESDYRREIAETPMYHDGAKRPEWHELQEIARWQRVRIARRELSYEWINRQAMWDGAI